MNWYAKDFQKAAGSVPAYLKRYAPQEVVEFIDRHGGNPPIKYMAYDWSLNRK